MTTRPPTSDAASSPIQHAERLLARHWRVGLLACALTLGVLLRALASRGQPLWFDETFTGAIAGQQTASGLLRWLTTELTGPAYYVPMWGWARVFGVSDVALRVPSQLCAIAAPLFILWRGSPDRDVRLFWGVSVLLWLPSPILAGDARPYALLFLLGCIQATVFSRLLGNWSRRRVLVWATVTSVMGLAHYWSLSIGATQGLLLLLLHPRRVMRDWPAFLPFMTLGAWMLVHLPFVFAIIGDISAPGTTISLATVAALPGTLIGSSVFAAVIASAIGWSVIARVRPGGFRPARPSAEAWTAISGCAAIVMLVGIGAVVPSFALRYLVPAVPAILLGLAAWARWASRDSPAIVAGLFGAMIIGMAGLLPAFWGDQPVYQRHFFNLAQPSAWLMQRPVDSVVFLWTDPAGDLPFDTNLGDVGGFFFGRAGRPVAVRVLHTPVGSDVSAAALRSAGTTPRTAILWVASQPATDPARMPRIATLDPSWECRDFGNGLAVAVGCRRRR